MLTIAIQAGGASRRMGQDKALIRLDGELLINHVIKRMSSIADEIFVTTGNPEQYGFLDVRVIQDLIPKHGPLGGLHTSLKSANYPLVAAVACDMPFASVELVKFERDTLLVSKFDVAIPSTKNGLEPLHAVYRCDTCLPAVEKALKSGERRLISWLDEVQVRFITPEEVRFRDPSELAFWNINTPEEFIETKERMRKTNWRK